MNFRKVLMFSAASALFFSSFLFGAADPADDQTFISIITSVLSGNTSEITSSVSTDAYLVYGNRYEHLYGVISGSNKELSLKEDALRKITFYTAKTNDSGTGAFVTVKTDNQAKKKARFHTVVFMKNGSGIWKIVSWHTSV